MNRYVIGLDYGTLSCRALLVNAKTGQELVSAVFEYPHGVMDEALPDGTKLPADWALQHPLDYLTALDETVPAVIEKSGVSPEDVIGIGLDFTSCTILPVDEKGVPLCLKREFMHNPHAYVKLWKHHGAQRQADRINALAKERKESWLKDYGGNVSSEMALPKILQVYEEAPEIYEKADGFPEAANWVLRQLTGKKVYSTCTAGYKELWAEDRGFPGSDFFEALAAGFSAVTDKLSEEPVAPGRAVGKLCEAMAGRLGLKEGIAVSAAIIDAHAALPAAAIDGEGKMLAIIGTSTCFIILDKKKHEVPGMSGVVKDGILPGFYSYEAGQPCVGDLFAWYVKNCLPAAYEKEAQEKNISVHQLLREKAMSLAPGESGLLALDWWNGTRSVLMDGDLSGLLLGMTLHTKPEEIYRALLEATAYSAKNIMNAFLCSGVEIRELYASGGIPLKDPLMMQIYADVLNMPIRIAGSRQGGALGAAIFASLAAGEKAGGYDDPARAVQAMGSLSDIVYRPVPEHAAVYRQLFDQYIRLHDYFGRGENNVMKLLKSMKSDARLEKENTSVL